MEVTSDENKPFMIMFFKFYCVVLYSALGVFNPYIFLYFRSLGFTGTQIGLLAAVLPLSMLMFQPVWGFVSDTLLGRKKVLQVLTLSCAIAVLGLFFVQSFYGALLALALVAMFSTAIIPVIDSIIFGYLTNVQSEYGPIRLWGSVGFSVTALGAGYIFEQIGLEYMFLFFSGIMIAAFICSAFLPDPKIESQPQAAKKGILRILGDKEILLFLFFVFLAQSTASGANTFYGIFLIDLGGTEGLLGIAWMIGALSELPLLAYSRVLLPKYGPLSFLFLGSLVYGIRWFSYAFVHNPIHLVMLQGLHGMTFIAFYMAGVTYINEKAPNELKTTAQTIFWAMFAGLSFIAGNFISGRLFDIVGIRTIYMVLGCIAIAAPIMFLLLRPIIIRHKEEGANSQE